MAAPRDLDRLELVIELIALIESELADHDRTSFLASRRVHDLAAYRLSTIGENLRRLSPGLKDLRPDLPWAEIYAFRNIVVHDYGRIDPERVWDIARDLASLDHACRELRSSSEASE